MEDIVDTLLGNAPKYILVPLLFVYLVINVYSNFSVLKEIAINILRIFKKITSFWQDKKREKYNKMLIDEDYIKWQKEVMRIIYMPLIEQCNKSIFGQETNGTEHARESNEGFHIVNLKFENSNTEYSYEAFSIFLGNQIGDTQRNYPFADIFPKKKLVLKDEKEYRHTVDYLGNFCAIYKEENKKQVKRNKKLVFEYEKIIRNTVSYPNKIGYMLEEIVINNRKIEVAAKVGNYYENILQTHILEYELYKFYMKELHRLKKINRNKKKISVWESLMNEQLKNNQEIELLEKNKKVEEVKEKKQEIKDNLLEKLPIRKSIHKQFDKQEEYKVLLQGKGRKSLLSVQILTFIKNQSGSYDCLRIRRSNSVAAKAGYIQFIPSGGFEAFNDGIDKDSQRANYSVNKVLFRELAEECFGLPEGHQYNKLSPEIIYTNEVIKKIISGIDEDNNKNKVEFEFLGITESLVGLRPEFSFIMKIDDESIISEIIRNEESRFAINLIDVNDLEDSMFWNPEENNDGGDLKKLNCTSAGLFELAKKSELYGELLNKKMKPPIN